MEESKESNTQTAPHSSQQLQVGISSKSDGPGTFCDEGAVHGLPSDKSGPVPLSAGGFQPTSPVVFVSALPAPSSLNQSQVSVMQPAFVLMPSFSSPLENVSSSLPLSQMEAAHFRLDGQPAYLFQVQGAVGPLSLFLRQKFFCCLHFIFEMHMFLFNDWIISRMYFFDLKIRCVLDQVYVTGYFCA